MSSPLPPELIESLQKVAASYCRRQGSNLLWQSDVFAAIEEVYPLIREHVMREDMEICKAQQSGIDYAKRTNRSWLNDCIAVKCAEAIERAMKEGKCQDQ